MKQAQLQSAKLHWDKPQNLLYKVIWADDSNKLKSQPKTDRWEYH